MARTRICAELGTTHHGDVSVALAMIQAAAETGADAVKIQHYGRVHLQDPQWQWLTESRLEFHQIQRLAEAARERGLEFWATPFDAASLELLLNIGVDRIKIASSEARATWWPQEQLQPPVVVSWPWGKAARMPNHQLHFTAIPLYPTPLEAVYRAPLLDGWSDHTVGLSACQYMIARGAQWVEVHLKISGKTRCREWEKEPLDFMKLREFAEDVETFRTGVGEVFRNRWSA